VGENTLLLLDERQAGSMAPGDEGARRKLGRAAGGVGGRAAADGIGRRVGARSGTAWRAADAGRVPVGPGAGRTDGGVSPVPKHKRQ
jgi:hypothetical protein